MFEKSINTNYGSSLYDLYGPGIWKFRAYCGDICADLAIRIHVRVTDAEAIRYAWDEAEALEVALGGRPERIIVEARA